MRIQEITTIKPIQPLTPSKVRINALKQQKNKAADALRNEQVDKNRQKLLNVLELHSRLWKRQDWVKNSKIKAKIITMAAFNPQNWERTFLVCINLNDAKYLRQTTYHL